MQLHEPRPMGWLDPVARICIHIKILAGIQLAQVIVALVMVAWLLCH